MNAVPPLLRRRLCRTGLDVSVLGFGTAPLGHLFVRISDAEAIASRIVPCSRLPTSELAGLSGRSGPVWPCVIGVVAIKQVLPDDRKPPGADRINGRRDSAKLSGRSGFRQGPCCSYPGRCDHRQRAAAEERNL